MSGRIKRWILGTDVPTRRATMMEAALSGLLISALAPLSYAFVCWTDGMTFSSLSAVWIGTASGIAMMLAARLLPVVPMYDE